MHPCHPSSGTLLEECVDRVQHLLKRSGKPGRQPPEGEQLRELAQFLCTQRETPFIRHVVDRPAPPLSWLRRALRWHVGLPLGHSCKTSAIIRTRQA
jgi:hypothetical protein